MNEKTENPIGSGSPLKTIKIKRDLTKKQLECSDISRKALEEGSNRMDVPPIIVIPDELEFSKPEAQKVLEQYKKLLDDELGQLIHKGRESIHKEKQKIALDEIIREYKLQEQKSLDTAIEMIRLDKIDAPRGEINHMERMSIEHAHTWNVLGKIYKNITGKDIKDIDNFKGVTSDIMEGPMKYHLEKGKEKCKFCNYIIKGFDIQLTYDDHYRNTGICNKCGKITIINTLKKGWK